MNISFENHTSTSPVYSPEQFDPQQFGHSEVHLTFRKQAVELHRNSASTLLIIQKLS